MRITNSIFDQLKQLVDSEGANLADPDGLGMLAAIGIVKGQPFTLDANTRTILDQAAKIAYKMSRVIGFEEIIGGRSYRVYPDRRWVNPLADGTPSNPTGALDLAWTITAGGYLALDARINFFTNYYSISPGMVSQTPGSTNWMGSVLLDPTQESENYSQLDFFYFNDDGLLVALRYDNWKIVFAEQREEGFNVWQEPFVTLRLPKLFNLRSDPLDSRRRTFPTPSPTLPRAPF